jgi:hypothetical protein
VISMLGVVMVRWNSNTMTRFRIDLSKLQPIHIYLLCLLKILRQSQLFCKMMWLSKQGDTVIAIGASPVVHQVSMWPPHNLLPVKATPIHWLLL